jgi:hypothetical protein
MHTSNLKKTSVSTTLVATTQRESACKPKLWQQVRFSELVGYKFLSSDSNEVSIDPTSNLQAENSVSSDSSLPSLPNSRKRSRLEFQATHFPTLGMGDPEECFEPTNLQDGPGPATLMTCALVTKLVTNGSIQKSEISKILQRQRVRKNADGNSDHYASETDFGHIASICGMAEESATSKQTGQQLLDNQLCRSVQSKLSSLSSRITRLGRAILPPSTNIMGKQFVPALDFLHNALQDFLGVAVEQNSGLGMQTTREPPESSPK